MYVCMYVCMYSVGSTLTRCWNWLSDVAIILILLHTQRTKLSDTSYTIMICGVIHTVQAIRYSNRYRIAVGIELCSSFIYELISLVFSLGRRSDRLGGFNDAMYVHTSIRDQLGRNGPAILIIIEIFRETIKSKKEIRVEGNSEGQFLYSLRVSSYSTISMALLSKAQASPAPFPLSPSLSLLTTTNTQTFNVQLTRLIYTNYILTSKSKRKQYVRPTSQTTFSGASLLITTPLLILIPPPSLIQLARRIFISILHTTSTSLHPSQLRRRRHRRPTRHVPDRHRGRKRHPPSRASLLFRRPPRHRRRVHHWRKERDRLPAAVRRIPYISYLAFF